MDTILDYILFTIFICVFQFQASWGQVSIVTSPVNLAVLSGQNAEFECKVQQPLTVDYLSWSECITTPACIRINNDDTMIYVDLGGDAIRGARYSISVPAETVGQYNLRITGTVFEEDSGTYTCTAKNAAVTKSAQLILLESDPACTSNITTNATYPVDSLPTVHVTCTVAYSDPSGKLEPKIQFIKQDIHKATNVTLTDGINIERSPSGVNGKTLRYILTYQLLKGDAGDVIYARTYFTTPDMGGDDNAAINAPTYEHYDVFGPMSGADCLRSRAFLWIILGISLISRMSSE